jgi:glycosyltransferase involved in cell wall biosynthesis
MIFSIILPAYNEELYIIECLDSIVSQNISQELYEVIVIDDCSTDRTFSMVNDYQKIQNLHIVSNKNNVGLGFSRNNGIALAKGKYLLFLDSDDILASNSLNSLLDILTYQNPDIIVYNWDYYHSQDTKNTKLQNHFEMIPYSKEEAIKNCLSLTGIDFTNNHKLVKTSIFKDNNIYYKQGLHEDMAITLKVFYFSDKIALCQDLIYIQRLRDTAITASFNQLHIFGLFKAWQDMLEFSISTKYISENKILQYYTMGLSGLITNILIKTNNDTKLQQILYDEIIKNRYIKIKDLLKLKTKKSIITNDFILKRLNKNV